jgi:hypothetical protein
MAAARSWELIDVTLNRSPASRSMALRFLSLPLLLLSLLPGCTDQERSAAGTAAGGELMKLGAGMQWIGRVQRSSGGAPIFDTLRVDSTLHADSLEWYHFGELTGTRVPRPDWLEGEWITRRSDGLYTTRLQSYPDSASVMVRRLAYPVTVGDTVLDFGATDELSLEGAPLARSHEIGIITAVDEEIEVPAGRFTAYRVELRRLSEGGGTASPGGAMYDILWFSPGPGLVRAEAHADSSRVDQVWELSALTPR